VVHVLKREDEFCDIFCLYREVRYTVGNLRIQKYLLVGCSLEVDDETLHSIDMASGHYSTCIYNQLIMTAS